MIRDDTCYLLRPRSLWVTTTDQWCRLTSTLSLTLAPSHLHLYHGLRRQLPRERQQRRYCNKHPRVSPVVRTTLHSVHSCRVQSTLTSPGHYLLTALIQLCCHLLDHHDKTFNVSAILALWRALWHDVSAHMTCHHTSHVFIHDVPAHMTCHHMWNVNTYDMSPHMTCHHIWCISTHDMSPHVTCHHTWHVTTYDVSAHMTCHHTWHVFTCFNVTKYDM